MGRGRSIGSDIFQHHRRAQQCIAQAALTNSKRPETFVKGTYPTHLKRGHGCWLWDMDGKKYLDFVTGLGTNIIGYANQQVNAAINRQAEFGACLSLSTTVELEAAEKLKEFFPFVDAVKFLKTGSEACSAAVRIARAKTGRMRVLSDAYHGWHDPFVSLTPPALGVPLHPEILPLKDAPIDETVAAVIIEPVVTDFSRERIEYLKALREECTKAGALLIFDEVITGFRFPKHSVASWCGVTPDLIVLGKAIANGMPLAAVGGKFPVMNCGEYFVSSSYAGETLSLAAAIKTMTLLQTKYDINILWKQAQAFIDEFNGYAPDIVKMEGYPTRGVFKGEALGKALFFQECCKAGILVGPSYFINYPTAEELNNVKGVLAAILGRIKRGEVQLEGEMPASPFAQKVREQK
jgi:glutamate-1-semialdehyde 2,1-aminomutase